MNQRQDRFPVSPYYFAVKSFDCEILRSAGVIHRQGRMEYEGEMIAHFLTVYEFPENGLMNSLTVYTVKDYIKLTWQRKPVRFLVKIWQWLKYRK